jgi:murein DD-endopeptidase MepM/ murein hydrolase activator NlpD
LLELLQFLLILFTNVSFLLSLLFSLFMSETTFLNVLPNNMTPPVFGYGVTCKFGNRHLFGRVDFHNGTDLGCPADTKIKCPAYGIVLNVSQDGIGGNWLRIQHDNGLITGYAHLSKILVVVGQKVEQNDIIAESGNTGLSTGAHLHFTCYENEAFQDPERYFVFVMPIKNFVPPIKAMKK